MQKNRWFGMRANSSDIEQIKTLARLLGVKDSQAVRAAINHAMKCIPDILAALSQDNNASGVANVTD